jgi:hypothetical protein
MKLFHDFLNSVLAHYTLSMGLLWLAIRPQNGRYVQFFWQPKYYIFSESPARRAEFQCLTGLSEFPAKFCRTRWVENVRVASKFLKLMSGIEKYVNSLDFKSKALNKWRVLEAGFKDPLLRAKICFFISVAQEVEPFLKSFQSTKPMVSFYIAV